MGVGIKLGDWELFDLMSEIWIESKEISNDFLFRQNST